MHVAHFKQPAGFTILEVLAMVFVATVMAMVVLPHLARARGRYCGPSCVNNQKQIGVAFRVWALDHNDKYPMQVSTTNGGTMELVKSGSVFSHFLVMSNELSTPIILFCPNEKGPGRTRATTFAPVTALCSPSQISFSGDTNLTYFVAVDASDEYPQRLLMGDDNFTVGGRSVAHRLLALASNTPVAWTPKRHRGGGNIGLADGSVMSLTTPAFRKAIAGAGAAEPIAIP